MLSLSHTSTGRSHQCNCIHLRGCICTLLSSETWVQDRQTGPQPQAAQRRHKPAVPQAHRPGSRCRAAGSCSHSRPRAIPPRPPGPGPVPAPLSQASTAAKAAPTPLGTRARRTQGCARPAPRRFPEAKAVSKRAAAPSGPSGALRPQRLTPGCLPPRRRSAVRGGAGALPVCLTLLQGLQRAAIAHQVLLLAVAGLRRRHLAATVARTGHNCVT